MTKETAEHILYSCSFHCNARKPNPDTGFSCKVKLCLYLQQNVWAENEREEKFVLLKQRSTHITVEVVGEVVRQVTQTPLYYLGLVAEGKN